MKAKLFITTVGALQLVLENGTIIDQSNDEKKDDFVVRATQEVNEQFMESLEIEEVALKTYKRLSTTKLNNLLKDGAVGLEKEAIETVLGQRSNKDKKPAAAEKKAPTKKEKKAKAEKKPKAEKKAKQSNPEREEAIAAAKNTKAYKDAKKHVGSEIEFTPSRKGSKKVKGTIKNLSLSKDLSRVYFSVEEAKTKRRVCCSVNNETVKIG